MRSELSYKTHDACAWNTVKSTFDGWISKICTWGLEGSGNLLGLKSCFVFFQERDWKSFENSIIKLSAKEKKWTGQGAGIYISNL